MANYKQMFMDYMDADGTPYSERNEHVVRITYIGDNLKSIPVYVFFDEDGDPMVQMKCWEIANFKGKEEAGKEACHKLNAEYRWIKFYLDSDSDVVATIDAYLEDFTCGEMCDRLVNRLVNITDDAYPTFARAMWG